MRPDYTQPETKKPAYIATTSEGYCRVRRPFGEDNPELEYVMFAMNVALSETPLRWAAEFIGPAFSYTLYVGIQARYAAYDLAVRARDKENPLSPYINIISDTRLGEHEWVFEDEDKLMRCGSEGI